jgi:hypothetical protein
MTDESAISSLDDIRYDLEGLTKLAARLPDCWADDPAVVRTRGGPTPEATGLGDRDRPGTGQRLIAGCQEANRRRFSTLLRLERSFLAGEDHACLIGPACLILESETDRLLTSPARVVAGELVESLRRDRRDHRQADILRAWAERQVPATIGVASLILLALRRGCESEDHPLARFLSSHFRPRYAELLMSKKLGRSLDRIREGFRNPACHGTCTFDRDQYAAFVRLMVGNDRFDAWHVAGPHSPDLDAEAGFLHDHLSESWVVADAVGAGRPSVEALLGQVKSRESPQAVRLEIQHADPAHVLRDIEVGQPRSARPFRLGDSIRLTFQPSRDGHLALIDVGTSGGVSVLFPNRWSADGSIAGGRCYGLPGPSLPVPDLTLSGLPGTERLLAIATRDALPVPLRPEGDAPFRTLSPEEIRRLLEVLDGLDPTTSAIATHQIEIVDGGA